MTDEKRTGTFEIDGQAADVGGLPGTYSLSAFSPEERVDGAPWASMSLFERIARRSGDHRTYYRAMRNEKGQLCRTCH